MSSFSDLSRLSDISGVSRISSSTRVIGKSELACSSEYSVRESNKRIVNPFLINVDADKVVEAFRSCEDSICEYARFKIILDCVKQVSRNVDNGLSEETAQKLKRLLIAYESKKFLQLPAISIESLEELTILGITDLPKITFSYEEKMDIKSCAASIIRNRIHRFLLNYEKSGGNLKKLIQKKDSKVLKKVLNCQERDILRCKTEVEEVCTGYKKDLLKGNTLLNRWKDMKHEAMGVVHLRSIEYLLLQAQVAELQAEVARLTCTLRLFNETPITLDAFKILSTDINEKIFDAQEEIKRKTNLKKLYNDVESPEYNEILKRYKDLNRAIIKRKQFLHLVQSPEKNVFNDN
ncbi:uncharacterized protein LOC105695626 [Orussus abietinus]|uniref:uncharacterized protein LOC105695626 n=1 Tax=Orussus abietinus TaxID=222816 RepID=UPI000625695B|nr:uncharacterized protein LOC105695626 [Orussus abietinus]